MEGIVWLIVLCLAMGTGSFMAGSIPLALHFDEKKLKLLSTLGSGILVGTALIVIIPEGVETLYQLQNLIQNESQRDSLVDLKDPTIIRNLDIAEDNETVFKAHHYIGVSLALGFAIMFLIEHLGNSNHSHQHPSHITVSDMRNGSVSSNENKKGMSATIGLVVHSAADGIALGAASADGRGSLEFMVFLAIMLHKAPSAFGLTTFLLQEGYSRRTIREHLMIFSLSAPLCSLATYFFLLQNGVNEPHIMQKWTGILLLFSAGTFLYVSTVHILPEIYNHSSFAPLSPVTTASTQEKSITKLQIVVFVLGIFSPLFLMIEV
ncbi:hypothetical protein HK099_004264 [Clydaea vesicula]|uniref:Uncharacterized protein n=1 Tax=Clydaea vesicula TaxID=447962 RepID=A0AAD5U0X3_9FUNG|nr:hypothetical protein HK099_004264 [Clydaea vesicula]KAJ3386448.1 hypothetical protein HDU92_002455 [Lobulomyces angularis]